VTVQRGHLRLVEPDEVASFEGTVLEGSVDTTSRPLLLFRCPSCGKQSSTDRPVTERWCVGGAKGTRTHMPVQMTRDEVR
jgi:hypothetical protein